jgi:hypothetical protein
MRKTISNRSERAYEYWIKQKTTSKRAAKGSAT